MGSDGVLTALVKSVCESEHVRELNLCGYFGDLEECTVEQLKLSLDKSYGLVDIRIRYGCEMLSIVCDYVSSRNRCLWQQRAALHALARFNGYGFATLASLAFRNRVLEYFLPGR